MSCPSCGSWAVRSDRSLAGRLICGRCGQPLTGTTSRPGGRRRSGGRRLRRSESLRRWGLLLLLLLLLLKAVWLVTQPQTPRPSPDRPGLSPGGRPI